MIEISVEAAKTLLRVCSQLPPISKAADKISIGKAQQELEDALRK